MGLDDGSYVSQDLGCRTGKAFFGGHFDRAAPSSLIEGVDCDSKGCEVGEKIGVAVAVIAKAMDVDKNGLGLTTGRLPRFGVELDTIWQLMPAVFD